MLPMELKRDKYGLLYTDDVELIRYGCLDIDKRVFENERYYTNKFYSFPSTDDYIIKFSETGFTRRERRKMLEMLDILVSKQKDVKDVDFPIGYYAFMKKFAGFIIPYYKNGIAYDQVLLSKDINELSKYYPHDEDGLHNMVLLLYDVLDLVQEMFDNGIYYSDINPGNIILTDEKVRLIDFDYRFVKFVNKDESLTKIMQCYKFLLNEVLENYKLAKDLAYIPSGFEDAKVFTKKMENKVRKS